MHPTRMLLPALSLLILPLAQAAESPGESSPPSAAPVEEVQPITDVERPLLPRPPIGPVPSKASIKTLIDQLAQDQALDPVLVHALIRAESGYDPHAVSHMGAVGLMQVMPRTAADYGVQSIEQLFDPEVNLHTGMRHLKRLLGKYGAIGPAVMAYNAGEGALERSGGFVTYPETQRYTHRVLSDYLAKKGLSPYSQQARDLIGLDLRPEMAIAGDTGTADSAMPGQRLKQSDWSSRFNAEVLQEPALLHPMPQSGQLLSRRLDTASNSPLRSRLMKPQREERAGSAQAWTSNVGDGRWRKLP
ncbi:lytic transglycosylase domain-containing protein [Allochromatium palmeri]|uniref:Transglycosylase SLT domain-containing protein n=1 Tax=Allochromatium palmeri TaxID=231048 RepID=A0A6N8ED48_9GAMM|nr:lytic transglycosylase domain-containing protein [Allochromatium palmeri]MTW21238.1 transglycosylase SLT domain-containing protein [Allochromatium palmeri]